MGRACRQLTRQLEEGTFEIAAAGDGLVHQKNPRDVYFDTHREQVALEAPYAILPSMALPPGHAFATRHPNGTPLLVYRDKKNPEHLRAFVNSCRHRGSPLLRENTSKSEFTTTALKAPLLTCPYHAWTYDAQSGDLKKIPGHEKAFDLMNKEEFGLEVLTCTEDAGIVWVGGDQMRDQKLWSTEELSSEWEPFLHSPVSAPPEAYKVFGYREWTVQANWQLAVETALESYHIKSLHSKTFNVITHSSCMSSQYLDGNRNAIMTVPLRSFQAQDDEEVQGGEEAVQRFLEQTTTTSLIFPATLSTLVKRFLSVITIEPINSTSSKVRSWALPHRFCDPAEVDLAERDFKSIVAAVEEDWDCVEQIQKGLTNKRGTSADFVFGGYEGNNVRFLQNIGEVAKEL